MFKLYGFPEKEVICDSLYAGLIQCLSTLAIPPKIYEVDIDSGCDHTWVQCDAPCKGFIEVKSNLDQASF